MHGKIVYIVDTFKFCLCQLNVYLVSVSGGTILLGPIVASWLEPNTFQC